MMTNYCGLFSFDLAKCVIGWLPWWWWMVPAGIAAMIILGILYKIKTVFGWPGVLAVWSAVMVGIGYYLGKRNPAEIEHTNPPSVSSNIEVPVSPHHNVTPKPPANDLPPKSLTER